MPRFDASCTHCGFEESIIVPGGQHPPCTKCGRPTEYIWHTHPLSIQTDEAFIGGVTIENLDHDPVTVYSRAELKLEMAKRNLEQQIKYVPGDQYLTDWSKSIDPQTLENAKFLLEHRTGSARR